MLNPASLAFKMSLSIMAIGWLQLVGSIKLQVSFAEYCLCCRALLQKRPVILSILLTKATPYVNRGFTHAADAMSLNTPKERETERETEREGERERERGKREKRKKEREIGKENARNFNLFFGEERF